VSAKFGSEMSPEGPGVKGLVSRLCWEMTEPVGGVLGDDRTCRRCGLIGESSIFRAVPLERCLGTTDATFSLPTDYHDVSGLFCRVPNHYVRCWSSPKATGPSDHGLKPLKL
jgi:hypothetical protein